MLEVPETLIAQVTKQAADPIAMVYIWAAREIGEWSTADGTGLPLHLGQLLGLLKGDAVLPPVGRIQVAPGVGLHPVLGVPHQALQAPGPWFAVRTTAGRRLLATTCAHV